MYELTGVMGERLHSEGHVLRMKSTFKIQLKSDEGVKRFIDEQTPFAEIKIVDLETGEDKTGEFLKSATN